MKKSLYFVAILLFTLDARFSLADTIDIFNVNAGGSPVDCNCGGPIEGTLTIDVTEGIVIAVDISAFNDEDLTYFEPAASGVITAYNLISEPFGTISTRELTMVFTTVNPGSLVGFSGGTVTGGLLIDRFDGLVLQDNIQGTITFQSTVVPEPSTLALALTGLGLLAAKTRRCCLRT